MVCARLVEKDKHKDREKRQSKKAKSPGHEPYQQKKESGNKFFF